MLYVEQFRNNRLDYLKQFQRLHSTLNGNFSLCSDQYIEKYPKFARPETSNISYSRQSTLFLLSKKASTNTHEYSLSLNEVNFIRMCLEMNRQQLSVVLSSEEELSVQGQRLRNRPTSFWLYYSDYKTNNENQQQTPMIQRNKNSTINLSKNTLREDDKPLSNENTTTRWYHQVSRNANGFSKSTSKGNPFTTSFSLPMQTSIEPYRPTTAPLVFDDDIRQTISTRMKANTPRPFNPHVVDLSTNLEHLTPSSVFQYKPKTCESPHPFVHRSLTDSTIDSPIPDNLPIETKDETDDQSKTAQRNNQLKMNGFQHIANLGSWQRRSKTRPEKSLQIEHEEEPTPSEENIYEYKSPFSEEYDQAIALQAQFPNTNNYMDSNEWSLKDFYRDVKTPFESETNTKPVFEKCLKLSRLQANTIKWEQRRRQNLNIYNRLIRNSPFDGNILSINGNFSPNLADLKRELRCNECKRVSCQGNCAPGQEYHQYKRLTPFSSLPNPREPNRTKLGLRPRSQQTLRTEQSTVNPVLVVPLFDDESSTKRPPKKLTPGFLPGRSFRPQRRDTLTFFSSHKIPS